MNLKELSNILGLSQTTVSRALNGYPEVKEATRQRVIEAAQKHDYIPNRGATSLATGRSMLIGHVVPAATTHEMVNPIFGDFIAGALEVYARHGYDLLLSRVDDKDETRAYQELHRKGTVDGVIVQMPCSDDSRIKALTDLGLPFVVHGRASQTEAPYSWVDVNNRSAFKRATDFLLDLGHRRIALINGLEQMDFAQRRREGYLEALAGRGVSAVAQHMVSGEMTEIYGYLSAGEMLEGPHAPTAFLVSSLIPALGVRRAIEERGLRMGRDISIIIHDDELSYLQNGTDIPIFTATRSSVHNAGRILANMLLRHIANPQTVPEHVLLESTLVVGQSTGPLRVRGGHTKGS